jgi:ubiquitin conjugation factor E4 A
MTLSQFIFNIFQTLSQYAEENIEATDPPLFLRFINLLINDAIFLLDEALDVSI